MTKRLATWTLLAWLPLALAACDNVNEYDDLGGDGGTDTDTDTDTDADTDGDADQPPIDGLDLLIMIDNSISMSQEQGLLATSMYALVAALVSPLPTALYPPVDDFRIAVVTSNMGFSSDGVDNDDAWPTEMVEACAGFGDDGMFRTQMPEDVELANDAIPCDESAAQCPDGWTCAGAGGDAGIDEIGACHTDGSTDVECPYMPGAWAETSSVDPDPALAGQAGCLTQQGTTGCGWEQPLASVDAALHRPDQAAFLDDSHLLAILAVGDEDDCSMQYGAAMFAEEEVVEIEDRKVNLACGYHPEHLFATSHYYAQWTALKGRNRVVFAAVTGVPYAAQDPEGAYACQGFGNQLDDCLSADAMQYVDEWIEDTWLFRPACTRTVGTTEVTRALPARRFVELANESFGSDGFVFSICNEDWSPAFAMINTMLTSRIE